MSTHEAVIAFEFVYSTLSGDANLANYAPGGIHRGFAQPGTVVPFVVMGYQAGSDTLTMNAVRVASQPLLQIKAVGPASMSMQVGQAASEIDDMLKRTSGSAAGGLILAFYRETPLFLDQEVNGEPWVDIGGLYRSIIQQTS